MSDKQFADSALEAIDGARHLAERGRNFSVEPEHLLASLVSAKAGPVLTETSEASKCSGSTEKLRPRSARCRAPSIASSAESANCLSLKSGGPLRALLRQFSGAEAVL